jgi:hypothetical protein
MNYIKATDASNVFLVVSSLNVPHHETTYFNGHVITLTIIR